jgi:hypothetical protein
MTPERTSTYSVGDIYSRSSNSPVIFKKDCFDANPREGTYTSLEVVQAMKAGARVPLGVTRVRANGMQYKQLKFADPYMQELAEIDLVPSAKCQQFLAKKQNLSDLFIIKAVLSAEVKEQLCRTLEGGVGVAGLGVTGSLNQECTQASEGHVVVAFKTQPVDILLQTSPAPVAPTLLSPVAPPQAAEARSSFTHAAMVLSVDDKLRHQKCESDAQSAGLRLREGRMESAVAASERSAHEAWADMETDVEKCVLLNPPLRTECITVVEGWLDQAKAISVTIQESIETIQTDCGEYQPAFTPEERTFEAKDVVKAKQILRQLRFSDSSVPHTVSTGTFEVKFRVAPQASPAIDTLHVLCHKGGFVKGGKEAVIPNAGKGPCRVDAFAGSTQMSATVVISEAGIYNCFPNGVSSCTHE